MPVDGHGDAAFPVRIRLRCVVTCAAGALASLVAACPAPLAAGPVAAPAPPELPSRDAGGQDAPAPLASFFAAHAAEIDQRLALPTEQYLAHEQTKPRGFADYGRRRSLTTTVHNARMFAFQFGGSCGDRVVGKDGRICDDAVYPGALLTPEQTRRAAELLHDAPSPASWGRRAYVSCYDPHHAVVFFDERGVPVADITVCFECGNFKLAPGPDDERSMTEDEAAFFAETCRAQNAGGCPPRGASRMPAPPQADPAISYEEHAHQERRRMLARDAGVNEEARLAELSPAERRLTCAWLMNGSRGLFAWECADGRVFAVDDKETCSRPPARCDATVGDLVACARSRLADMCREDSPRCAKSDACKRGVMKR